MVALFGNNRVCVSAIICQDLHRITERPSGTRDWKRCRKEVFNASEQRLSYSYKALDLLKGYSYLRIYSRLNAGYAKLLNQFFMEEFQRDERSWTAHPDKIT